MIQFGAQECQFEVERPQDFPTVYPLGIYNLSLLVNSPSSVPPCEYDQSVLV